MGWFTGRVAVVTGAARGIGEAVARQLVEHGARIVAVDVDDQALRSAFGKSTAVERVIGDLAGDETGRLASEIVSTYGPVTLLVNNVGISTPDEFFELDRGTFDRVMATNLRGPWFFTRDLAADLIGRGEPGAFVFISSLHDRFVFGQPHYSASKAAVSMLVRELAQRLGPHGIRVNAVSPGAVRTQPRPDEEERHFRSLVPLRRMGDPRDVARVTAALLNDEWCGYVTGANVPVDGGLALHSWSVQS